MSYTVVAIRATTTERLRDNEFDTAQYRQPCLQIELQLRHYERPTPNDRRGQLQLIELQGLLIG